MFQFGSQEFSLGGGGAAVLAPPAAPIRGGRRPLGAELVPDLGHAIGSRIWWRGLASLAALCAVAVALSPGLRRPIAGPTPAPLSASAWQDARAQGIAPLAFGADTGRRMAATDLVRPLAQAPERPSIDLTASFGAGDTVARVLERAGVAGAEARQVATLVAGHTGLADIPDGARADIRLGRRPNPRVARPLDALTFRARFDLRMEVARVNGSLVARPVPIRVDNTPLRIQGVVGEGLYRAARAAGAPADAVASYLRAV